MKRNKKRAPYFAKGMLRAMTIYSICVLIIIIFLCSFFGWQPEKTVDILLGLLAFAGTIGFGAISLYQNYTFKEYADEKDRQNKKHELILQTTPLVIFKKMGVCFFAKTDFIDITDTQTLLLESSARDNWNGKGVQIEFIISCDNKNYLSNITFTSAILRFFDLEDEQLFQKNEFAFTKLKVIDSFINVEMTSENTYSAKLCLGFGSDVDMDNVMGLFVNSIIELSLQYTAKNMFSVSYDGSLQIMSEASVAYDSSISAQIFFKKTSFNKHKISQPKICE